MNLEKLGTFIQTKREEVGIPLAKAAKKAGIGRSTLWILERGENPQTGKPSRPSKETLERLAEVLYMSQEETEELLSLADYRVTRQTLAASSLGSATREPVRATPVVTEINGVIYYAYEGYLQAYDPETGRPRWPKPARIQSPADELARPLPRKESSLRPPQRQETKQQRIRDTEPLKPNKSAHLSKKGIPERQPELKQQQPSAQKQKTRP